MPPATPTNDAVPTPVGSAPTAISSVGPITVPTTGVASPAPTAPPAAASLATTTFLSGAVLAAIITATVTAYIAVWAARRKNREAERARQRDLFARAFQAYASYKEMPHAIRRRRHDAPADERLRLSEITREIQERLSYFVAWTAAESITVGDAYAALVSELRKVAGGAMHEAWLAAPITDDASMNIPPTTIDLSSLKPLENSFATAVRNHLAAIAPWWAREP